MKITCKKCGKRFDGEEHLYICPKCNHYHSQVGARGKSVDTVSASNLYDKKSVKDPFKEKKNHNPLEGSVKNKIKDKLEGVNVLEMIDDLIPDDTLQEDEQEFIQTLNGDKKVYTAVTEKKSESTESTGEIMKKIGTGLSIVIGFIIFISSVVGDFDLGSDDSSWDDEWGSSYTEELQVDYGQPMEFETFTVNVGKVSEPEFDGLEAEDGWKLVQVNFETESPYEYEDGDVWTEVSLVTLYDEESYYDEQDFFAVYESDIASDNATEKELREAGLVVEAHYSGKYFCIFEIPEDTDNFELKVTSFVPEDEDSWNYEQHECFRMPIEL